MKPEEKFKVNNIKELRDTLAIKYEGLCEGNINIAEAKAVAYVAGKIIYSCRTQLEYNKYMQKDGGIAFLDAE